ncbi:hypothetical protein CI109_102327 [Kwoniella shandongensis]|uniref:Uncharacterized protein n=1 Tax=Kwoniella shandongensis TaxID=1734106 RepID=A0A5M6C3K5_9TREE|nr:uncharacterized protein CI109_003353 [Kwoniella shandongensis]KAA5528452.1 hypothetical protein CI109_003353 [Kwoniella shandongensis]
MTNTQLSNGNVNGHSTGPVDILLIGLGSIGSVYSYLLEKSGRARVTAVARSNYSLYSTTGATLDTDRFGKVEGYKPHRVFKSQKEALEDGTRYAFALVCTKCLPDVLPNTTLLADAISSGQVEAWSLIQNGLGVEEDLYQAVKESESPVMSSCAWLGVVTSPDGTVVRWTGNDLLVTGIYPPLPAKGSSDTRVFSQREDDAVNLWSDLIKAGEGNVKLTDRIDSVRFSKNVWNCAWASVQGLTRTTSYPFSFLEPEHKEMIKSFLREIVTVGFESSLLWQGMIQYPAGDVSEGLEAVVNYAWDKPVGMAVSRGGGHRMSLLVDVEMGRPFEVEVITGAVLRLAQKHNVPTPRLEFIYAMLKALQANIIMENKKKAEEKAVGA